MRSFIRLLSVLCCTLIGLQTAASQTEKRVALVIGNAGYRANGPYAKALAKHLAAPGLEVHMIFREVQKDVLAATGGQQRPYVDGLFPPPSRSTSGRHPRGALHRGIEEGDRMGRTPRGLTVGCAYRRVRRRSADASRVVAPDR